MCGQYSMGEATTQLHNSRLLAATCEFILFDFSSLNFMIKKTPTYPLHSESGTPLLSQSFLPIKHFSPHTKKKWQKLLQPRLQNPF